MSLLSIVWNNNMKIHLVILLVMYLKISLWRYLGWNIHLDIFINVFLGTWPWPWSHNILRCYFNMWPSTGKLGTTRHPSKKFFWHLRSCRRPDIELSKFYRRSLSRSHYNRPNRSLPSAWNNTFLRNRSIFSWYLCTPRCARFSCRRSHMLAGLYPNSYSNLPSLPVLTYFTATFWDVA